jgi:hypothetical protein
MSLSPIVRISGLLVALCFSGFVSMPRVAAQEATPDPSASSGETKLPKDFDATFGHMRVTESGDFILTDRVTLSWKESRIQADRMLYKRDKYVEAEGNVLIAWGGSRLFGSRMTYDLQEERGFIEDAVGEVNGEYIFWAKRAEKTGEDLIRVDHYARMYNVRPRATKVPFFYLPFLMWPVKPERAPGLLLPEFSSTDERGQAYSQELFIPIGRSADLTLLGRYYSKAGFGGGGELRFIPNPSGVGKLSGFYIFDQSLDGNVCPTFDQNNGCGRYAVGYEQTQEFRNGFRMVADINLVSDFDFYSDFSRNLDLVSTPTILTRVEFSRNGQWSSLNVRELRREQLLASGGKLVQQTLPEVEWRGRSRKLGKTPLYLSYESSFALIQQTGEQERIPIAADYFRGDVFPTLSLPFSPRPWFDISPSLIGRLTYYTQQELLGFSPDTGQLVSREVLDDPLDRRLWGAALSIIGPKAFRVFETGSGSLIALKHTFEPRVSWSTWQNSLNPEERENIIVYDEVDLFSPTGDVVIYGLVQRLFAKRPRTQPEPGAVTPSQTILLPDGTTSRPSAQPAVIPPEEGGAAPPTESLEIASLEIAQSRSLDATRPLSRGDLDDDLKLESETTSLSSPIGIIGRYNPNPMTTFDLRSSYDIVYKRFTGLTLSGTMRNRLSRVRMSLVHTTGLGRVRDRDTGLIRPDEDDTQLRLTAGMTLLGGKMQFDVNGTVNFNPAGDQPTIPDRAWRMRYSNQCCTFVLERLVRDFPGLNNRDDWNFRVELRGVGKLLDVKY